MNLFIAVAVALVVAAPFLVAFHLEALELRDARRDRDAKIADAIASHALDSTVIVPPAHHRAGRRTATVAARTSPLSRSGGWAPVHGRNLADAPTEQLPTVRRAAA